MNIKRYVGDKNFYKKILAVSVPIMIQNGITNFVNMLDNIMVGSLQIEAMSGVSIVNQFIFILNLLIFGAVSAAGIFTAQYHGLNDTEGEKHTFRFKLIINLLAVIAGILIFFFFQDSLIKTFLHSGSETGDLALTLSYGKKYLNIMLIGLVPYTLSQVYASTMRETGQTVLPMIAGIAAMATNLIFNTLLIFGFLGFPALGVAGAAIATVLSRFVELAILVVWGHTHKEKCPYLVGAYRSLYIPRELMGHIIIKGIPIMFNELLWASAMTMRNQCYSVRGLDAVAALNINSTILNVFNVVYIALGCSIAIVVGNLLGAGELEEAKDTARKMIAFSIFCAILISILYVASAFVFPKLYNAGSSVRLLATYMMIVSAVAMPFNAYANAAYFTLRSGGKVLVTFLFDSGYMWAFVIPLTALFAYLTPVNIFVLFAIGQSADIIKCALAYPVLRKGTWAKQIV
ncbi:MAG: MATE family efflux transporter [Clostridia bacterium]|nr:MATE family efflux transporter [Clostridia bacterium]